MKNQIKLFLFFITVCLTMFICTGCWNYREIEQSAIIAGLAIDKGTGDYKYHVTFEVVNFSSGSDQSIKPSIVESEGNSFFDALRYAVTMSDQKLYVSSCKIVILSKAVAEEGIKQIMDFFIRDAEPRITVPFVVSDEETAAKILNAQLPTGEPVSYKIYGMLDKSQNTLGHILTVPLYKMYNTLSSESQALTLPGIRLVEVTQNPEPQLFTNVIFKQDKMAGYMHEGENFYYLMLKNELQSGVFLTQVPNPDRTVTLEILDCNVTVKPIITGDDITMEIKIKMNTAFGEDNSSLEKYEAKSGELKKIEDAAAMTIKNGLMNLILSMQKNYNADVFGFGEIIYKDKYEDWEKISDNWESVFPKIKCEIKADIRVVNSATALPKGGN